MKKVITLKAYDIPVVVFPYVVVRAWEGLISIPLLGLSMRQQLNVLNEILRELETVHNAVDIRMDSSGSCDRPMLHNAIFIHFKIPFTKDDEQTLVEQREQARKTAIIYTYGNIEEVDRNRLKMRELESRIAALDEEFTLRDRLNDTHR